MSLGRDIKSIVVSHDELFTKKTALEAYELTKLALSSSLKPKMVIKANVA